MVHVNAGFGLYVTGEQRVDFVVIHELSCFVYCDSIFDSFSCLADVRLLFQPIGFGCCVNFEQILNLL